MDGVHGMGPARPSPLGRASLSKRACDFFTHDRRTSVSVDDRRPGRLGIRSGAGGVVVDFFHVIARDALFHGLGAGHHHTPPRAPPLSPRSRMFASTISSPRALAVAPLAARAGRARSSSSARWTTIPPPAIVAIPVGDPRRRRPRAPRRRRSRRVPPSRARGGGSRAARARARARVARGDEASLLFLLVSRDRHRHHPEARFGALRADVVQLMRRDPDFGPTMVAWRGTAAGRTTA